MRCHLFKASPGTRLSVAFLVLLSSLLIQYKTLESDFSPSWVTNNSVTLRTKLSDSWPGFLNHKIKNIHLSQWVLGSVQRNGDLLAEPYKSISRIPRGSDLIFYTLSFDIQDHVYPKVFSLIKKDAEFVE